MLELWKNIVHQKELLDITKDERKREDGVNAITHLIDDALIVSGNSPRKNKVHVLTINTIKALITSFDSSINSWVLDSEAFFHTTTHHTIMENYVARN